MQDDSSPELHNLVTHHCWNKPPVETPGRDRTLLMKFEQADRL